MDFPQIDSLLRKLKNLEREEYRYKSEIKHNEQCLEATVNSRLEVFKALAKHGIRNTFDLRVYLTIRKSGTVNECDGQLLNAQEALSSQFQ
jgi:hypothetical protein